MASITLNVGQSVIATVTVLDQYGNPFPYDLNANVPSWTISDPSNIGLEAGGTPDTEKLVANGASTATLTVNVPGVPNPTDTASVTAVMAPAVASKVQISFGTAS